jgi:DNA gyrase subunit A
VRDGLKPVHRRILYASQEGGFVPGRPYRKCAKIVGDVMGNYHPHGDSSIYDGLARMAQDWSMRVPLIDGQGNFGSMDPDPPASMRYTEARLAKSAMALLEDIDKDTVDFQPNYDGSRKRADGAPGALPQSAGQRRGRHRGRHGDQHPAAQSRRSDRRLLATISTIAAANRSPRRADGDRPRSRFPDRRDDPGPGRLRARLCMTGRGSIMMRSRYVIEEGRGDRRSIVLTEIPFQVGKNGLVEKIAEAAKDKRIEGVSDIRDESNREGVRIVIDLKRDATAEVVLNQLWRHTRRSRASRPTCSRSAAAAPKCWGCATSSRRSSSLPRGSHHPPLKFELAKARDRAHILLGLVVAVTNLDEVVKIIRGSPSPAVARAALLAREWPIAEIAPYIRLVEAIDTEWTRRQLSPVRSPGPRDPRPAPASPHRARPRRDRRRTARSSPNSITELLEILGNRAKLYEVMREELTRCATNSPPRAAPRSPPPPTASTTRT